MSVKYRMRRWYDHWFVLVYYNGSVLPRALLSILVSTLLSAVFWSFDVPERTINVQAYGYFMQCAALVLAFTTNISYNRFWEALGHLTQMTTAMSQAASHVLAFDECVDDVTSTESLRWRAITLHFFSILHAVCCQMLFSADGEDARLDILGGLTDQEKIELSAVSDQATLCFHWINERVTRRVMGGGLRIPPPICSQLWTQLGAAMTSHANAVKILETPLPLPYQQCLAWSDIIVILLTPYCVCSLASTLTMALLLTFCTCAIYHSIYLADVTMQQPFGNRSNDLPLVDRHRDFIDRLISFVSLELANEINCLYEHVDSTCQMTLSIAHHSTTLGAAQKPVSFRAIEVIPRRHSEDCGKAQRLPPPAIPFTDGSTLPISRTYTHTDLSQSLRSGATGDQTVFDASRDFSADNFRRQIELSRDTYGREDSQSMTTQPQTSKLEPLESRSSVQEIDATRYGAPSPAKQVVTHRSVILGHADSLGSLAPEGVSLSPPMSWVRQRTAPHCRKPKISPGLSAVLTNQSEPVGALFLGDKILAKEYVMPAHRSQQVHPSCDSVSPQVWPTRARLSGSKT